VQLHSRLPARISVRPDAIATTPRRKTVRVGGIPVPENAVVAAGVAVAAVAGGERGGGVQDVHGEAMASYPQLELDRQLCFALYTASRAVVRTYGPLLDEAGLTYPQYVTLLALWEDPERSRSVGELGERLHLDSGTLTPLLKRLASMGYVTRARDADDERRVLVTLTAEGLTLRERLAGVPESFLGCLGLDVPEADALRDQLAALTALLERGTQEP
jgi:MarR family transcriptional regulator, organic hydroperoxide resistance regulator